MIARRHPRLATLRAALVSLVVSVLAIGVIATPAQAYSWTGCRWPNTQIYVRNTNLSGTDATTAGAAQTAWSNQTDVQINTSVSATFTRFVAADGATGVDGFTTWTCSGGTTTAAAAHLNTTYTNGFVANKRQAIWVHELGHGLGLGHSASLAALMYTSAAQVYNTTGAFTPQSDDVLGINARY